MSDSYKETLIIVGGILLFFGMLLGSCVYDNSMKNECRIKAIEKGMGATDILAICK